MKTALFKKLLKLCEKPFIDPHKAGIFLGCSGDNVRRLARSGMVCAIKGSGSWKILTESLAAWIIRELWQQSENGNPMHGVDPDELMEMATRFGIIDKTGKTRFIE